MQTYSRNMAAYILDEIGRIGMDKCFNKIAESYPLSTRFLMEMGNLLDMYTLSSITPMDVKVYERYNKRLNWVGVTSQIELDQRGIQFLVKNVDKVDPVIFDRMVDPFFEDCGALSEIINYFLGRVMMKDEYWCKVSTYEWLDEEFLRTYDQYLKWYTVSQNNLCIPTDMIINHKADIDWVSMWINYGFTDEELRMIIGELEKDSMYIDWCTVSANQPMTEEFMAEYSDKLNWVNVSEYQSMSLEFMKEHSTKLNTYQLLKNQVTPKEDVDSFMIWYNSDNGSNMVHN